MYSPRLVLGIASLALVILEQHPGRVGLDGQDEQPIVVAEVGVAVRAPGDGHRVDAAWMHAVEAMRVDFERVDFERVDFQSSGVGLCRMQTGRRQPSHRNCNNTSSLVHTSATPPITTIHHTKHRGRPELTCVVLVPAGTPQIRPPDVAQVAHGPLVLRAPLLLLVGSLRCSHHPLQSGRA